MIERLIEIFRASLFELGGQSVSLLWLFQLFSALLIVSIVTRFLKSFLKHRLLVKLGIDGGNREAIATLTSFCLGAFGYLLVLQATGVNLSSLAVIIGGFGVGIGFSLQDIIKNLLSGLTILVERKLRVGDFIEFDNVEGYIEEISIRSTVIRRLEGAEVVIPNSQIAEERITNWSYHNFEGRIAIEVGVAYGSDPVLVTETLLEAAYSLNEILSTPRPEVMFVGFGDSALNFELWAWTNRIDRRPKIKSHLTFTVEYYLRRNKIDIPFPQLDLWMRSPAENSNNLRSPQPITLPENKENRGQPAKTLRASLAQISYFQNLNELQMRSFIEMGYRKQFEKSEILIQQGDVVREFCIVLTGAIGAFHGNDTIGNPEFTFEAGMYFGELPLMLGIPSPGTLKALVNTVLFVIDVAGFEKLLQDYPTLAEDITSELANRKEMLENLYNIDLSGLNKENEQNPVVWIQQRFQQLFNKILS
ncbi:MAG: mechanosensitive ion channel [Cyanobacteria bacterium SBLK]|nr:mechanosensitive ion channel [Cyanobacteria bacterium SBLK]